MIAAMPSDGPHYNSEIRKVFDQAILRVRRRLTAWVRERMPVDEVDKEADQLVDETCQEFAAIAAAGVLEADGLASPELTFDRLRSIAGRRLVDRARTPLLPRLTAWVQERTPAGEKIDWLKSRIFAAEAAAETWEIETFASPELTFDRLRSTARQWVIDQAISRSRPDLLAWVRKRMLDDDAAEDVTQNTCEAFALKDDFQLKPEMLASPKWTLGYLRGIATHKIVDDYRAQPNDTSLEGADLDPLDSEQGQEDPFDETLEQIRQTVARLMDVLDDRDRLVLNLTYVGGLTDEEIAHFIDFNLSNELAAAPDDQTRDEILKRATDLVRKIRSRAIQKMASKGVENFIDQIETVLSNGERQAVRAGCWDGPNDETVAERFGINTEEVRSRRRSAFDKARTEADKRGVRWSDLEIRVIWASYRGHFNDLDIASGLGIAFEENAKERREAVKAIRMKALRRMLGRFDLLQE